MFIDLRRPRMRSLQRWTATDFQVQACRNELREDQFMMSSAIDANCFEALHRSLARVDQTLVA